jgi:hypothetical protein
MRGLRQLLPGQDRAARPLLDRSRSPDLGRARTRRAPCTTGRSGLSMSRVMATSPESDTRWSGSRTRPARTSRVNLQVPRRSRRRGARKVRVTEGRRWEARTEIASSLFLSCLVVHVGIRTRRAVPGHGSRKPFRGTLATGTHRCRRRFGAAPIGKWPSMGVWEFGVLTIVLSVAAVYFLGDMDR